MQVSKDRENWRNYTINKKGSRTGCIKTLWEKLPACALNLNLLKEKEGPMQVALGYSDACLKVGVSSFSGYTGVGRYRVGGAGVLTSIIKD